jgi:hypothetical protein
MRTLIVSLFLGLAACGTVHPADDTAGETDDVNSTKADGPNALRMGDYERRSGDALFETISLAQDGSHPSQGTWQTTRGCNSDAISGKHCLFFEVFTGTFRLTKSGSQRFVRFSRDVTAVDGTKSSTSIARFAYTVDGDVLGLTASDGAKSTLTLQVPAGGPSGGGQACGSSTCGAGEFCCNASCGLCAKMGEFCTQQVCAPSAS